MMLSRSVASGAMLVLIMGAVGAAALQQEPGAGFVALPDAPAENTERDATAADRVVESAGFPVVPQAERDRAGEATHGPMVTVNGRPLGENRPAADRTVATAPAEEPVAAVTPQTETSAAETAAIEPPRPLPRPEGLGVPQQQDATGIDYEAIARAAGMSGQNSQVSAPGFLTPPDTQTLAPLSGSNSASDPRNREQDELVGVVGPNGEILWVYEEQVPTLNSRVVIERRQQVPQTNPFGFVYE